VVQNRQMITPEIVSRGLPPGGTAIERPPFEPSARPALAASAVASNTSASATTRDLAPIGGPGSGFASQHGSAPPTILMGGDPADEKLLLASHHFHSGREPLRAAQGTTLGGRYALHGSPGEFRGNASVGGGKNGGVGGPMTSHSFGGSGVAIASHGSSGGGSGGSSSGGGHSSGGGGGMASGGGGSSSSAGHSGGGGSAGGGGHH